VTLRCEFKKKLNDKITNKNKNSAVLNYATYHKEAYESGGITPYNQNLNIAGGMLREYNISLGRTLKKVVACPLSTGVTGFQRISGCYGV
jgi:hypothetical protein